MTGRPKKKGGGFFFTCFMSFFKLSSFIFNMTSDDFDNITNINVSVFLLILMSLANMLTALSLPQDALWTR